MSSNKMELKSRKGKSATKRKAGESVEVSMETILPELNSPLPFSHEPRDVSNTEPAKSSVKTSELGDSPEGPPSKKRKSSAEEIEVDITAPEPPSRKALRRIKKGKALPSPKSGADSSPEPEVEKPEKGEAEKRSEYGIWIGNLPWSVTKADLRTFFTSNSDITDETITRIHMPSPDDGKPANKIEEVKPWKKQHNKGFAYVDFSLPGAVPQALALSEQLLGGRRVLIKNNKSFEGRPQKTKEESRKDSKAPSRRVFLGNLRFDTNEESLKEHFEKCGAVENVMVATFEDSGKCKGYAWITFEELEAAESAVRGYALVEEDEMDPGSEADSGEESKSEGEEAKGSKRTNTKKATMKKWWVDKILKRPVRREFAEDAQARYKKRFGKDGIKGKSDVNIDVEGNFDRDKSKVERVAPLKKVEYRTPYAARLTGGIVESKGKKVVF